MLCLDYYIGFNLLIKIVQVLGSSCCNWNILNSFRYDLRNNFINFWWVSNLYVILSMDLVFQ